MSEKKKILHAIVSLAKELGRTPSLSEFTRRTGITGYRITQFFPRWNEAVRAGGLEPYRLYVRPDDGELLRDWGATVRKERTAPSRRAYLLEGEHDPRTLEGRFGSWEAVPKAFRKFAKGKREWADVVAFLSGPLPVWRRGRPRKEASPQGSPLARQNWRTKAQRAVLRNGPTYGSPMDFRGLRHAPVNKQGVVLLFGMVAKELGYLVEAVQKGFPDCEAKRQIAADRWERVKIEFEFESKNFRDHAHPASGCDVIVCWRHNWDKCPKHIEIVELSSVIKSLASSED
jgi:hypothetical protein